ncbi:MAG: hypothetical protein IJW67_11250 [Blautia sp.]|nr:hypothetical protein [Blautia sp.]
MKKITPQAVVQFVIILLMLDALIVSILQYQKGFAWPFVVAYWVILTIKNAIDLYITKRR